MSETHTDPRQKHFRLLLASIFLLAMIDPILDRLFPDTEAKLAFRVLVFAAAVWSVSSSWIVRWLVLALGAGSVLGSAGLLEASLGWGVLAGRICELLFYVVMIAIISTKLMSAAGVGRDTLYGAACNYLLIGLAFGAAYLLVETLTPGSFDFPTWVPPDEPERGLVYFSFVTLTTLGFGDVTPLTDQGASLVILESVIGILYPAIVIARLVSLYTTGDQVFAFEPRERNALLHQRLGQFEGLFLLILFQLATFPYVPYIVTRVLGLLTLGAALYALRTNRTHLLIGAALGLPALLNWGVETATSIPAILGSGFQTAFFLFTAVMIGSQVLRRSGVDREVVLGVCCVYLLLGAAWAGAYQFVFAVDPESFVALRGETAREVFLHALYLSYVTLTTLGFGDVLPLDGAPNSLATIEAVVGVLFPSIIIARLVSQYRGEPLTRPKSSGGDRKSGRLENENSG